MTLKDLDPKVIEFYKQAAASINRSMPGARASISGLMRAVLTGESSYEEIKRYVR